MGRQKGDERNLIAVSLVVLWLSGVRAPAMEKKGNDLAQLLALVHRDCGIGENISEGDDGRIGPAEALEGKWETAGGEDEGISLGGSELKGCCHLECEIAIWRIPFAALEAVHVTRVDADFFGEGTLGELGTLTKGVE